MTVNKNQRGSFGILVTEAAIIPRANSTFKARVNAYQWDHIDDDPPIEIEPVSGKWSASGRKLDKAALREIVGLSGSGSDPDNQLKATLLQEVRNREIIWYLWQDTVNKAKSGSGATAFLNNPLAVAITYGCKKPTNTAASIDLQDLMIIFHMFGDHGNNSHRPVATIDTAQDFFYTTEAEVADELARRVDELVYGVTWEGPVKGEKEGKQMVWHRLGLYCGCG